MQSGTRFQDYVIGELLGEGAAGAIYSATRADSSDEVAIKVLHESSRSDPTFERRFVREIAILQELDHDNIVRYLDCGLEDGQLFYTMELSRNGTLLDRLKEHQCLEWEDAVENAIHICTGLEYLHGRHIVHRDLKPSNLFLTGTGQIKLADFGIALDEDRSRITDAGTAVGSCEYMAPEAPLGDPITHSADLYAVGCILFEMLTGHPPYRGETTFEVLNQHVSASVPRVHQLAKRCPLLLSRLITSLLQKQPAMRPATATAVVEKLSALVPTRQSAEVESAD